MEICPKFETTIYLAETKIHKINTWSRKLRKSDRIQVGQICRRFCRSFGDVSVVFVEVLHAAELKLSFLIKISIQCNHARYFNLIIIKPTPYTLAGFDLTTHNSASRDDLHTGCKVLNRCFLNWYNVVKKMHCQCVCMYIFESNNWCKK
jgi:hypothetical protein